MRTFVSYGKFVAEDNFFAKPEGFRKIDDNTFLNELEKNAPKEQSSGLSGDYASALFSYGGILNQRDEIEKSVVSVIEDKSSEAIEIFHNQMASPADRVSLANSYFQRVKLNPQVRNLLEALKDRNLLWLLPRIVAKFVEFQKSSKGIIDGEITTILPLPAHRMKEYVDLLTDTFLQPGQKLNLTNKVDESLLGGVRIQVGGQVLDLSSAGKLNAIEEFAQKRVSESSESVASAFELLLATK